jgi:L-threonylcarbamoyladenylate synthase
VRSRNLPTQGALRTSSMTISKIELLAPDSALLDEAADLVATGRLVVAPTETRYGLLARADSPEALNRVFEAKGRAPLQATSIFVANLDEAERYSELTPTARALAQHYLPGPLTLVLRARTAGPESVVVNGKIGLRWSKSSVIAGLLSRVNFPITATSANRSGSPDLATAAEIAEVFGNQVSLYLDGGRLENATSTVVDATDREIRILREGAISAMEIVDVLSGTGVR